MAFSELELRRIDKMVGKLCRRVSLPDYADQLRFTYEVDGHAVVIWEERPPWDGSPGDWTSIGVAKFRYFRSRGEWQLYWMRSDLKWHMFIDAAPTPDLAELVAMVDENRYGCFFG